MIVNVIKFVAIRVFAAGLFILSCNHYYYNFMM